MTIRYSNLSKSALVLALTASAFSSIAFSQNDLILEEVMVTAQKRSQSLQDVPLAITALNGLTLRQNNITTLAEISNYVPNFQQTRSGISNVILIRGTGSGANNGFEQSVGTFRDGIYMGRARQTIMPLFDLARIEVVKGPQTILFGKNTIAGAVSIISAAPTTEFEGYVSGAVSSFDGYKAEVAVSGPLGDTARGRIALRKDHTDGWIHNNFFDQNVPEVDNYAARGKFDWDLSEDTIMGVMVERTFRQTLGTDTELISSNTINSPNGGIPPQIDGIENRLDFNSNIGNVAPLNEGLTETEVDIYNTALRFDVSLGEHSLTSITGFTGFTYDAKADLDSSPKNIIGATDSKESYDQLSQEFQFKSPLGQTFEYITGIYLQTSTFENDTDVGIQLSTLSPAIPAFIDGLRIGRDEQITDTISAFASGTWNVYDNFRIKAGLRYTYETKDIEKSMALNSLSTGLPHSDLIISLIWEPDADISPYAVKRDRSESDTSPMLIVEYDLNENTLLYASAIRGFKAGGYDSSHSNGTKLDQLEFDPEKAISYELGAKMTLLDGKANLNMAVFQGNYEDLQVSIFNGSTGFIVTNAGKSTSQGIELDGRYLVTPDFIISGSMAWLDNTYDSFENAPCNVSQLATNAQNNIAAGITGNARFQGCMNDLGGETLSRSPEWATSISASYTMSLGQRYDLVSTLDINYRDDQFLSEDLDPGTLQEAYTQFNGRIALISTDEKWTAALIGKNLTNEKILSTAGDLPFGHGNTATFYNQTGELDYQGAFTGIVQPPRNYSLDVTYNF
jgi:outer membrane receptor protein involved in Fe transport|tara:strand:+ start:9662 stop:12043 length:2382 start_codon:yes stop_codon:yes gene_type:complete